MIEIINLSKSFGGKKVLDGVNLSIRRGETTVIIGRSGCGKSVLLKHIVGLLRPDYGQVIVDGRDITRMGQNELNSLRLKIGMLFQGAALFDSMSISENVAFAMTEHAGKSAQFRRERVRECLSLVGLKGIEELKPAELSGGMKKRVGLARAICMQPEIILYDEPTTGVDPIMGDAINDLIKDLHDKLKVTSIAVTHDMKSAYKIADKIAMLYNGRIIIHGTTDEIRGSDNPIVQQFITGAAVGPITEAADSKHILENMNKDR
ncbi:MAG: ABC transporter ATP-binding protein [Candidatus Omnitrophota bacterium]